jgi:hypothetical protein
VTGNGAVFKRCRCHDPETQKRLERTCPRLSPTGQELVVPANASPLGGPKLLWVSQVWGVVLTVCRPFWMGVGPGLCGQVGVAGEVVDGLQRPVERFA